MHKPRAVIADDHLIVIEGLRLLVEQFCDVVGTAENGQALVEAAEQLRPDVVFLDISMPLLNGLDAARKIRRLVPETKLLFLTMHSSPTYAAEAFSAGADGYLLKESAVSELRAAVSEVLKGRHYLTPAIAKPVLQVAFRSPAPGLRTTLARLTPRQREVLQLVAEGKSGKEAAALLHVSPKTIEFHKGQLMRELDLHSTAELTRFAIAEGLIGAE